VTYWIPKPTSPLWSPVLSGLFGKVHRRPLSCRVRIRANSVSKDTDSILSYRKTAHV
jgi:hypothetical protein